jgi:hypothetical protein
LPVYLGVVSSSRISSRTTLTLHVINIAHHICRLFQNFNNFYIALQVDVPPDET